MVENNKNKLLDKLQKNLIKPLKKEFLNSNERISQLETIMKNFTQRFLILKILLAVGICLHLWCSFMGTYSWLWIIYLLFLLII